KACVAAASGELGGFRANWTPGASVCVVLASEGYPAGPITALPITGLEDAARVPGAVVFHAGTRREGSKYYSSGGRILNVCARGSDTSDASRIVYDAISNIQVQGSHYRRDIGSKGTKKGRAAEVYKGVGTSLVHLFGPSLSDEGGRGGRDGCGQGIQGMYSRAAGEQAAGLVDGYRDA